MKIQSLFFVGLVSSLVTFGSRTATATPDEIEEISLEAVNPAQRASWAVPQHEAALDRARKIVGLGDGKPFQAQPNLVKLSDDNTPFLKERLINRPIWNVVVSDWSVELKSDPAARDRYQRTLDVYIDPEDGKVLKILSRWPDGAPPMRPMPDAEEAEFKFRGTGDQFHGFPEDPPTISFTEVLDCVHRVGVGSVPQASQIMAHYVLWSNMGRQPRPVWVITLWGIPPAHTPHKAPVAARRCFTNVIDARTGEFILAGNTLCPEKDGGTAGRKPRHRPAP